MKPAFGMLLLLTFILACALLPVQAQQPQSSSPLITVQEGEKSVCCLPGAVIRLAGHYNSTKQLSLRYLDTGNNWEFKRDISGKSDDYSYDWKAPQPGVYRLAPGYTANDNTNHSLFSCTVTVLAASPFITDLPQSAVSDVAVTAHERDSAVFHADSIAFVFNEKNVNGNARLQVRLPISSLPSGSYPFTLEATDKQKGRFFDDITTVDVPERVRMAVPASMTLAKATDTVKLHVVPAAGITLSKVSYVCDGQTIAAADKAPWQGTANFSAFASGSHAIEAIVDTNDGNQYHTPVVTFSIVNQPQDKEKAEAAADLTKQQAQTKAAAEAKGKQTTEATRIAAEMKANLDSGFRPRAGYDEAVFRQQVVAYAYNPTQPRTGKVGVVKGLSIYVENDEPKFGIPNIIEAIVKPGTGQTNFLAFSEEDSRIAAQTAAEVCKSQTAQMGFKWDWSKYDLTVSYQENDMKHGGPSAGVADTVALMSAVLNMPVDSSVAVTGAISLHGDVLPVGGVAFKADTALNDPDVKVLIIPNDTASTDDLMLVYRLEPKVFFNKHIIFAKDMDTVFRYALIGWNSPAYNRAKGLTQEALRQFGKNQDGEALHLLDMAKAITPEDIGTDYWITLIKAVDALKSTHKVVTDHNEPVK